MINIRPGVTEFLKKASKIFEVIIFTAGDRFYAEALLNHIDPDHQWIHHRLYREHCLEYYEDFYIKDLRCLGRDLKNVVIVDNAPYSFSYQLDNGYPIVPFSNDKKDQELEILWEYLEKLVMVNDVREINKAKFDLEGLCSLNVEQYTKYYESGQKGMPPSTKIEQEAEGLKSCFDEFFKEYK